MAGVCWLYSAMRNYSDESIAIKLKYFWIYRVLVILYIYTASVLSFPHTFPTLREFLWGDKGSEEGEYPRHPDNLSCCHPPTSAGPWKRAGKVGCDPIVGKTTYRPAGFVLFLTFMSLHEISIVTAGFKRSNKLIRSLYNRLNEYCMSQKFNLLSLIFIVQSRLTIKLY